MVSITRHVGPAMSRALTALAAEPYSSAHELAKQVGPHGSSRYGYEIVHRLLRAHLARIDVEHPLAHPRGNGAVVITEHGSKVHSVLTGGI